ncbi:MAG: hypothetical protein DRP10_02655 [Candidatus Aenigmatarchaeota archaeon]|nr:MAG: hypothetical protein DRP10_02655 [Candidatus Aenigmarchaeota archaeon]
MKVEEIIGLLSILCAIFLFGLLIKIDQISLAILLIIGGLIFFVLYTKNNYAIFGVVVLIFSLLLTFVYREGWPKIVFSNYYTSTIILFLIIILGFTIAYSLLKH